MNIYWYDEKVYIKKTKKTSSKPGNQPRTKNQTHDLRLEIGITQANFLDLWTRFWYRGDPIMETQ